MENIKELLPTGSVVRLSLIHIYPLRGKSKRAFYGGCIADASGIAVCGTAGF